MKALFVYGSLMHKKELKKENVDSVFTPCILKGFQRSFFQEPSYRKGKGIKRAVLRVDKKEDSFINGILFPIKEKEFKTLDLREKGYDRIEVDLDLLEFKYGKNQKKFSKLYIYLGKEEKRNTSLEANEEYLKLCLEAASSWGEEFYKDFLKTTL